MRSYFFGCSKKWSQKKRKRMSDQFVHYRTDVLVWWTEHHLCTSNQRPTTDFVVCHWLQSYDSDKKLKFFIGEVELWGICYRTIWIWLNNWSYARPPAKLSLVVQTEILVISDDRATVQNWSCSGQISHYQSTATNILLRYVLILMNWAANCNIPEILKKNIYTQGNTTMFNIIQQFH